MHGLAFIAILVFMNHVFQYMDSRAEAMATETGGSQIAKKTPYALKVFLYIGVIGAFLTSVVEPSARASEAAASPRSGLDRSVTLR